MLRRLAALPVALALALAPALASAGIPVGVYPFKVPGLAADRRAELHDILATALASAARRGILAPRSPVLVRAACGEEPAPGCLARLAEDGLVLAGRAELSSGVVLVTAALWDATGARTREVRFAVDLVIQNVRPVTESLLALEMEIEPDGRVARDHRRLPVPPAAAKQASAPPTKAPPVAAKPPAPRAAAKLAVGEPAPRAPHWKRKAAPWLTGVGAALVAGGAAVAWMNRGLADDLDARYARGGLRPSDASSYDRVRAYNVVSTALLAAGGVTAAAGGYLWISAPPRGAGAAVGAGGRF
jgi:hypothetical protein